MDSHPETEKKKHHIAKVGQSEEKALMPAQSSRGDPGGGVAARKRREADMRTAPLQKKFRLLPTHVKRKGVRLSSQGNKERAGQLALPYRKKRLAISFEKGRRRRLTRRREAKTKKGKERQPVLQRESLHVPATPIEAGKEPSPRGICRTSPFRCQGKKRLPRKKKREEQRGGERSVQCLMNGEPIVFSRSLEFNQGGSVSLWSGGLELLGGCER